MLVVVEWFFLLALNIMNVLLIKSTALNDMDLLLKISCVHFRVHTLNRHVADVRG